jgi:hypothetical protein
VLAEAIEHVEAAVENTREVSDVAGGTRFVHSGKTSALDCPKVSTSVPF